MQGDFCRIIGIQSPIARVIAVVWLFGLSAPIAEAESHSLGTFSRPTDDRTEGESYISDLVPFGSNLFFVAEDGVHGEELWFSDGTTAGTRLVKDLLPGGGDSFPSGLTVFGGNLFFSARNGTSDYGLWKSDGTEAGTVLVKAFDSSPSGFSMIVWNGSLYLSGVSQAEGTELWKSDGTEGGTVLLKNIRPDGGSFGSGSSPQDFIGTASHLFFTADDGTVGRELWVTDGTAPNTMLLKDIRPTTFGTDIDNLTVVGSDLFFTANDGTTGEELWKSNGTAAGTQMVKDIRSGGDPNIRKLVAYNGKVYFYAHDGINGYELWASDGTTGGTALFKDIRPGNNTSLGGGDLAVSNGILYFGAYDQELWKTDGTTLGTELVKDLLDTAGSSTGGPSDMIAFGNQIIFEAFGDVGGISEPWISDGTEAGTRLLKDINPDGGGIFGLPRFTQAGSKVFFIANDGTHWLEMWVTDGTEAGTVLLRDIFSRPRDLSSVIGDDGNYYFAGAGGGTGIELWKSDGTTAGTTLVEDINPGFDSSEPEWLTNFNGMVFFGANDGTHGRELWKSDGTAGGTMLVKDATAGTSNFGPEDLTVAGTQLFYNARSAFGGLWRTDGTSAGTTQVADLWTFAPNDLTPLGNSVLFIAADPNTNRELWISDGTLGGTLEVIDLNPGDSNGAFGSHPFPQLHPFGSEVLMRADDGSTGFELWKTNGTAAGTVQVKDAGAFSNPPYGFLTVGAEVYYSTYQSLWKTDGTTAGTIEIKFLGRTADKLTELNGDVFFVVDDGTHGEELWKSDGTDPGTVLVKDIFPGSADSDIDELTEVGDKLYFRANDGVTGMELWESDGTTAGTRRVEDHATGPFSSWPANLEEQSGTLIYQATDLNGVTTLRNLDDEPFRINEVDALTQSGDTQEFIEIYGDGSTSTDGLVLVLFNGATDTSYAAFDLDGETTDANGFLMIGNSGVPGGIDVSFNNGTLQNGADAVALYRADGTDFPNGTPVTTTNLIDAVVYGADGESEDTGLTALLNAGGQIDESAAGNATGNSHQRIPNGGGLRLHSGSFLAIPPTPGAENLLPPTPSLPDLTEASDAGSSNTDDITNVSIPTFTGTAPPGSLVTLSSNVDGAIGTGNADPSGNWSITANAALTAGAHQISGTADGSAAGPALSLFIDTTAPAAPTSIDLATASDSGASPIDNITNDNTPDISGDAETGSTVTLYADGAAAGSGSANSPWTITADTLADGVRQITARATDVAGNQSPASTALAVTIDTVAPSAPASLDLEADSDTGDSNTDNITSDTTPEIGGSAEAGSSVTLLADGSPVGSGNSSGSWSITASALSSGEREITATAEDLAGNISGASSALTITIDVGAPSAPTGLDLVATSDSGTSNTDNLTNDNTPDINGVADAGTTVTLFADGNPVGTGSGGNPWTITSAALFNGARQITARAMDAAGNESADSAALTITIDTLAPAVGINEAVGQTDPADGAPVNFSVLFSEPVTGFDASDLMLGGTAGGSNPQVSGGPAAYTVSVPTVSGEGNLTITLESGAATDAAGNLSGASLNNDNEVAIDTHGDSTATAMPLPLPGGNGSISGWLESRDTDVFSFTLTEAKRLVIETTGTVDTLGRLLNDGPTLINDPNIDDDLGDGDNFRIQRALAAGTYFVEVSSKGVASSGAYQLQISFVGDPSYQPDNQVGKSIARTIGDNFYGTLTGQTLNLVSKKARAVRAVLAVENDGEVDDDLTVSGRRGNAVFTILYLDGSGNVTAAVVAGAYQTGNLGPGDDPAVIRIKIKPKKAKLKKVIRRGGRKIVKFRRKKITLSLRSVSTADETSSDTVGIRVGVR